MHPCLEETRSGFMWGSELNKQSPQFRRSHKHVGYDTSTPDLAPEEGETSSCSAVLPRHLCDPSLCCPHYPESCMQNHRKKITGVQLFRGNNDISLLLSERWSSKGQDYVTSNSNLWIFWPILWGAVTTRESFKSWNLYFCFYVLYFFLLP